MSGRSFQVGVVTLTAVLLSGCGIGYNRVLCMTKSNVGLDVDTKPPTAELTISRRELVIGPVFEGGVKPPVVASFRSKITGILGIFFNVSSTFAGGDASDTMTKLFGGADSTMPEDSTRCLSAKPSPRVFGTSIEFPGPGDVKPLIFGTDTSFGLKVAWSGTTAEFPDSVKLGYNRKEFALAPVFGAPAGGVAGRVSRVDKTEGVLVFEDGRMYHVHQKTMLVVDKQPVDLAAIQSGQEVSLYQSEPVQHRDNKYVRWSEPGADTKCAWGQYRVNVPSFLATVDHNTTAKGPGNVGTEHLQYFATGQSATNLALHRAIRETMLKRLDPEAASKLKTFRENQKQQVSSVESVQTTFKSATDEGKKRILQKAKDDKIVAADTTVDNFGGSLSEAVDGNDAAMTQKLEALETFAKGTI